MLDWPNTAVVYRVPSLIYEETCSDPYPPSLVEMRLSLGGDWSGMQQNLEWMPPIETTWITRDCVTAPVSGVAAPCALEMLRSIVV